MPMGGMLMLLSSCKHLKHEWVLLQTGVWTQINLSHSVAVEE